VPDYLSQLLDAAPQASVVTLTAVSAHFCLKAFLAIVATSRWGEPRENAFRVLKLLSRPKRPRGS
jgi:hypothetical protein